MATTSRRALPVAIEGYLDAIATGDFGAAVLHTDPQVMSALPPDAQAAENAPRLKITGRDALHSALPGSLGDCGLTVLVTAGAGEHWLVEGRVEGEPAETFAASFTLREELIARQLVFRCQLVEPPPAPADSAASRHDARAIVDRYFDRLEAGDFPAAGACFSADGLYSHPPYSPGAGRAEFRGTEELLAGFNRRGVRSVRHRLLVSPQNGAECLIEGLTDDTPQGGSFISSLSLDENGLIKRYVALFCQPIVAFDLPGRA
jgi:hypothetical protein